MYSSSLTYLKHFLSNWVDSVAQMAKLQKFDPALKFHARQSVTLNFQELICVSTKTKYLLITNTFKLTR